jgi:predicted small lipoprotein YifL
MKKIISTLLVSSTILVLSACGGDPEPLAAPADVPAGFETLQLTEGQAKDLNAWLAARKPVPDPSELAQYLKSLLKNDQQDALDKLLNSAAPVDPNAP